MHNKTVKIVCLHAEHGENLTSVWQHQCRGSAGVQTEQDPGQASRTHLRQETVQVSSVAGHRLGPNDRVWDAIVSVHSRTAEIESRSADELVRGGQIRQRRDGTTLALEKGDETGI